MQARNRSITDWYGKVKRGEIKLPRFQRHEAWDRQRVSSLIETVIHNLPLGITLVLEVGDEERFVSRYLETATPTESQRVLEHLLDGQQRLTALWRTLHNNYESETYFVYVKAFDRSGSTDNKDREDMSVFYKGRYRNRSGTRYPVWCDDPEQCLAKGYLPTSLLKPEDNQLEIDEWIEAATASLEPETGKDELKAFYALCKKVSDQIKDLRSIVANYNLPYLSLPTDTDKSVALDVFIKMNTNSKPLSQYDVIVAEVEDVAGQSLHDLLSRLDSDHPEIARYSELSDIVLTTSALLQDKLPNQRGAWDMDKGTMVTNWPTMERGLHRMAELLHGEGIFDRQRLPTNAVLAVIASLYASIPESGDKRGRDELLLRKYLWRAFFTDRYENAAATSAYADYVALKRLIAEEPKADDGQFGEQDIPLFSSYSLAERDELTSVDWPRRASIRGRAILAVVCRLGALDFATGQRLSSENINGREYHHVFPQALLEEAGIDGSLALNCALITDSTNASIGRKDPLQYMKDRYKWTTEKIVAERLQSHLIPIPELANGGYEGLTDTEKTAKVREDFQRFLNRRGELVVKAAQLLAEGRQLTTDAIYSDAEE